MYSTRQLTVANHEEVDSKNGKSFPNSVIRVLETSLHNSSINFNQDNTRQASDQHSVSVSLYLSNTRGSAYFRRPH
jgi:hypothetical protein